MPIPYPDPTPVITALQALVLQQVPWKRGGLDPTTGFGCYGVIYYAFQHAGVCLPLTVEDGAALFTMIPPPYQAWDVVLGCPPGDNAAARHLGLLLSPWEGFHASTVSNGVARFTLTQPFWRRILRHGLRYQGFLV